MDKAQGSLEYLIIIAAVLVVSGVVAMLVTGSIISNKDAAIIMSCQSSAKQCALLHKADSSLACDFCNEQCINELGEPVVAGAVNCCRIGNSDAIYEGSVENCVYVPPVCNNNLICDEGETTANCPGDCPLPACTPENIDIDCLINVYNYDNECVAVSCPIDECVYDTASFEGDVCDDRVGFVSECASGVCVDTPITNCDDTDSDGFCPTTCNANSENPNYDVDCLPICGNSVVEPTEDCDGPVILTCADFNTEGTLFCNARCGWDGCTEIDYCSHCALIGSSTLRDDCYLDAVTDNNAPCTECCPSIGSSTKKDECYRDATADRGQPCETCCPLIGSSTYKDDCYLDATADRGQACTDCCPNIGSSTKMDDCYLDAVCLWNQDYNICCPFIGSSTKTDDCYFCG